MCQKMVKIYFEITELWTQKIYLYLQKDSLEHFEICSGN